MIIGIAIGSLIFLFFIFPIIICSEIKIDIDNLYLIVKIKLFGLIKILKINLILAHGGIEVHFAKRSKFIPFSSFTLGNNKMKYLKNIKILSVKAIYKTDFLIISEYYKLIKYFFYYTFFKQIANNVCNDCIGFHIFNANNKNELCLNLTIGANLYIIFNNVLKNNGGI